MGVSKLALHGGPKVRDAPFPPWPHFADDEVEAATRILRSGKVNYWTGEEGKLFEKEYAAHLGVRHAIAAANGTVALELALRGVGVGPGDEVVVPSRTFVATASAAVAVGAKPVVCDVDRDSGDLTAETVRAVLTPRTKAVIPVHLGGWPVDMDPLLELGRSRGLFVIEDCAQAHGASDQGRPAGSMGHVNAFSFCQDKIVTTGGEGGLVATNDDETWARMWAYKDHGKSHATVHRKDHPPGFRWLHESFGTNWRLTEMQAAIGRVQLRKLESWVRARRENAATIAKHLEGLEGLRVPQPPASQRASYYRLYAFLDPARFAPGWDRERVVQAIAAEGVPAFSGSCGEIYREAAFERAALAPPVRFAVARELHETSLAFLTHPTMTTEDAAHVGEAAAKVLREAMR